ncbi:TonB-dependent receptor [Nitrosovibrio sp. Nv17]|uniref:TonB-dependent receptor n=1 Tax=Nitrosovibrio sp. Nv17 TaxID=1855339 RepID=UPI000908597C|nr:TonB-dependent receptor plug domain-containing protein [Nitrosovibrio sp. Nv17]SFW16133.1 iron complex outermembrane recepter protein [Nitrosovibrio sp. Nv17]
MKAIRINAAFLVLAAAYPGIVPAQDVAPAPGATLPTVDVTANPIIDHVRIDPFSSTSAVVTESQLRDQNAFDLATALRRTPGVQISRYNPVGGFGGDQGGAVYIRGMGVSRPGSEIKTYIDGVPFYMGVWNHPLLDLLPVNGMQSITVHKSPQPQVNGNNFASINLETKRATGDGIQVGGRISGGYYNTFIEQADLVGRWGDVDFMLAQGHARSSGHRANADGELNNVMGRVGLQLNTHWSAGASFLYVGNRARDPGDNRVPAPAVAPRYNTEAGMVTAFISHHHGGWRGSLRAYHNRGEGNWLHQPGMDGDTLSNFEMTGLRWKEEFSLWKGGTITAGLDSDWISGDVRFNRIAPAPQGSFDAPAFRVTSPYFALSQQVDLGRGWVLMPAIGIRVYDHSQFRTRTSPHAGLSLISEKITLFGNVSRGINYPGLEAPLLSSLIPPLGQSWKQLAAEQLDHAEVGVRLTPWESTQFDASVFVDRVRNRYVFGFPPNVPPPPQFINLGAYTMKGAEVMIRQNITASWTVFGGLTLLDPGIDNLPYTPRRAVTAGISGQVGPIRLTVDTQYQSSIAALSRAREAGAANLEKVDSFVIMNARVSHRLPMLGRRGEIFVAMENLLDEDYAYRPGYPMPGRWGQIGLSASF